MSKPTWEYEREIAALMAKLAEVERERDDWKKRAKWKHVHDDSLELELQRQLATVKAQAAERRKNCITYYEERLAKARREVWEEAARLILSQRLPVSASATVDNRREEGVNTRYEALARECRAQAAKEAP